MSPQLRALVVGLAFGFVVSLAPSCGGPKPATCDSTTCASGCCTASGECVGSPSVSQCGSNGSTCRACSSGQSCTNGTCVTTGAGGGSGTGGSTGTGGGTTGTGGGTTGTGGGTTGAGGGTTGAGGGTTGAGGGTTGSGGGTGGTGGTGGAGGGMGFPADGGVALTFPATCPAFTACGGNVNPTNPTTWNITTGCIDDAAFGVVTSQLDSVCQSTGTTVTNKVGRIQGSVGFTATHATRSAVGFVQFDTSTPNCNPQYCAGINFVLPQFGLTGSCAQNGTSCDCDNLRLELGQMGNDPYTVDGGTLSIMTAARTRTYNFCITGNTLTYRESTPAMGTFIPDPGVITLTR